MTEVAVSAESAPSIAGALSGKGEGGKIISTLGNTLIAVNQTKDISSSEVLNFLQSIHLSEKTTEALTFFATPITHQMIALADQVVSLFIELDDVKVDSKESETQKTEAQYKQHSPISEKKELPSMQFTKDLKTETKSSDSIFTLSRQVALPIKRGERSTEDGRIHNERGQERNIPKENSLTLTNQSTPKSSKDFVDYLRDQERRDQDQRGQDQREDDEPTPSHL
ncbi:MAG: hypothetical protein KDK55_07100, partial [Chlamydiia bacterium]|nr:hypothetical protein [Chlamydiia bacterium]